MSEIVGQEHLEKLFQGIANELRAEYGSEIGFVLIGCGRPSEDADQPWTFYTNAASVGPICALLARGLEHVAHIESNPLLYKLGEMN